MRENNGRFSDRPAGLSGSLSQIQCGISGRERATMLSASPPARASCISAPSLSTASASRRINSMAFTPWLNRWFNWAERVETLRRKTWRHRRGSPADRTDRGLPVRAYVLPVETGDGRMRRRNSFIVGAFAQVNVRRKVTVLAKRVEVRAKARDVAWSFAKVERFALRASGDLLRHLRAAFASRKRYFSAN